MDRLESITALWATAGVVNTAIVMDAAEGIVAVTDLSLSRQHDGLFVLNEAWATIC